MGIAPDSPRRVVVLGSGALKIGQGGEFDYSGSQALKALREEGIYSILINPNIATVQTSEEYADAIYLLPIHAYFVEQVIMRERADGILLAFGGQDALDCGLELYRRGVFERHNVKVLGTPIEAILATEDRQEFVARLAKIQVKTAPSMATNRVDEAVLAARQIGFPVMLRAGFALGGKGSGIAHSEQECAELAKRALAAAPQVLIEQCLSGWKEIEYEVLRDGDDNCITVCNMENLDPMGVHTGDSIVVAPAQTLDDAEYQLLRDVALKTIRHLGIIGECNIQFALNPASLDYCVIEVNARLSRSSALASKATGYPLAYVAAKLSLGKALWEIPNAITRTTSAFFEPALDYIICKVPRWDLEKFSGVDPRIGTEMKSVGEVMAIGRTFAEVLQKSLRMLDIGVDGIDPEAFYFDELGPALIAPTPRRIFAVAQALASGWTVEDVAALTSIDPFFLHALEGVVKLWQELRTSSARASHIADVADLPMLLAAKRMGFSDRALARCLDTTEQHIHAQRQALELFPSIFQIDTLAGEYPADTNYLYLTYGGTHSDLAPPARKSILVLGAGCYRIGSSVEFDWCCVNAVRTARELGYETIVLNCNPETVSTDYDICDRLVFDEVSLETVLELCRSYRPYGVLLAMGGQTPNNLALALSNAGVNLLGTTPESIDRAEDRRKFSALLDELGIAQPTWLLAASLTDAEEDVRRLGGFPVVVRPSYVLSGAAMRVAHDSQELREYLSLAADLSLQHPVVISKFQENAREVELDAVADHGRMILSAVCEHIENAGVHSGDATLVLPPYSLCANTLRKIEDIGERLATALCITGPFNVQLLLRGADIQVIECNLRASRSMPFVSKVLGVNFIREAVRCILGDAPQVTWQRCPVQLGYVGVKAAQFSFSRLRGADPRLGVEMAATGEVGCVGRDRHEALLKALLAVGFCYPRRGVLLTDATLEDGSVLCEEAAALRRLGLRLYTTETAGRALSSQGIACEVLSVEPGAHPTRTMADVLQSGEIDLVLSISRRKHPERSRSPVDRVRRLAVDLHIPLITDACLMREVIAALGRYRREELAVEPLSAYARLATPLYQSMSLRPPSQSPP